MYELLFFDLKAMRSDQRIYPSFDETLIVHKGWDIKNNKYEQSLFLSQSNDVLGPLHNADRSNFSFVRSFVK